MICEKSEPKNVGASRPAGSGLSLFARAALAFLSAALLTFAATSTLTAWRIAREVSEHIELRMKQILDLVAYSSGGRTLVPLGTDFTTQILRTLKKRSPLTSGSGSGFEMVVITTGAGGGRVCSTLELDEEARVAGTLEQAEAGGKTAERKQRSTPGIGGVESPGVSGDTNISEAFLTGRRCRIMSRTVFDPRANLRHRVFIYYPLSVVRKEQLRALLPIILTDAAGLALFLAAAFYVTRKVTRPIAEISRAAARVSAGDLNVDVPVRGGDETARLAAAFNSMTAGLKEVRRKLLDAERLAVLGNMAASVAHEIRNPLAAIRIHAQMLEKQLPDEKKTAAREMLAEIDRLHRYLQELLDIARPRKPKPVPLNIKTAVGEVTKLLRLQFEHAGITLELSIPESIPEISADPELFHRLLSNLLNNARQACRRGGKVRVEAASETTGENEAVILRVIDDGSGVDESIADDVFQPFVSGREDGTGLGLAVAGQAAEAHGWKITWHNRPEGGAVFEIFITCDTKASKML